MIKEYIKKHTETVSVLENSNFCASWQEAHDVMLSTLKSGGKILIAGNGGSAADAQHFAAELIGRFLLDRKGYPAIALTTDTSALTAIANDYGFEEVFSRQVEALGKESDCFVGITTSGNSQNIIKALEQSKLLGIKTVLLTGRDGGLANKLSDISLVVPVQETSYIQEVHLIAYHAWCKSLESIMHGKN